MKNETQELNTELRTILESEGSLTEDQVARVETIEAKLDAIELEAREHAAREKAEARLAKPRFDNLTTNLTVPSNTLAERYAAWALAGAEMRGTDGIHVAGTDAAGGYLVPMDLQNELVTIINGVPGARQAVESRTYGFDVEIARVASLPTITAFTGEAQLYDPIDVDFDTNVRSYAHKSSVESYISEELAQDARPAVIQEILGSHVNSHGLFWDKQYLVDGAGGSNGPEAIFDATVTNLNVMETAAVDTVTLDDLFVAYLETLPAQYRAGSFSWVMHPTVESVLRRERDNQDRFQLMAQSTGTDATLPGSTIAGIPIVISTNCPTYDECKADNTKIAVMLMERSSYRIFDRMPFMTQRDEFTKGNTGQVVFRSKMRSDGRWLAPFRSVGIKLKAS
ncbi:phage major capsid protein [bacterium]|nr:phage major capsid protein [bacterium]